jgi:ABC-type multidrug transport system ATPase subunit
MLSCTSGTVSVNGEYGTLKQYGRSVGFVPQDDIMLTELTVFDILIHSARMRLPPSLSHSQIRQKVFQVAKFLGISEILACRVGNTEKRGISGGQRKRVNVAIELVSDPPILLLDEPTSGLDSTTARELCQLLRVLAHEQKKLVVAVIHAPSPASLDQFDNLMLLGKTGSVFYNGQLSSASVFFEHSGCRREPKMTYFYTISNLKLKLSRDPDYLSDISALKVGHCLPRMTQWNEAALSDNWKSFTSNSFSTYSEQDVVRRRANSYSKRTMDMVKNLWVLPSRDQRKQRSSFLRFYYLFQRANVQLYQNIHRMFFIAIY